MRHFAFLNRVVVLPTNLKTISITRPFPAKRSLIAMPPKRKSTTKAEAGSDAKPAAAKKSKGALAIGDNVSTVDVVLLTENEKEVTLSEITKDKGVVIFMYPRANTPGCTKQACGFRDNYEEIEKAGFDVYGLSFDKPKSHTNWRTKYSLPYQLLTDDGTALKAFGAFKQPRNISRSHVIIKKGGEVVDVRNGISPGDSFTGALETIKSL